MKSRNEEQETYSIDDTHFVNNISIIVSVLFLALYVGFKTKSVLYGFVGGIAGAMLELSWLGAKKLIVRWDKYKIREKLPLAFTNFLRKNPSIRKWLGIRVGILLWLILFFEYVFELYQGNFLASNLILVILILMAFLFYLLATRFPAHGGQIVQFDEALMRLSINEWDSARGHFEKAIGFFSEHPTDSENCIKECVCTIEACFVAIVPNSESIDLIKMIKQLEGIGEKKIPPTIAQSIVKLYAYRGDARGVAHANPNGSQVSVLEAELVLNMVASYIIYLSDLYGKSGS